jgi:hypothetical protein
MGAGPMLTATCAGAVDTQLTRAMARAENASDFQRLIID